MATELRVPKLGMDMEEADIVRWLVKEGDEVEKGDPVLEIDTDKTSYEIEAPAGGVIRNLRGDEGETIPVGAKLAYIAAPGEDVPDPAKPSETRNGSGPREGKLPKEDPAPRVAENKPEGLHSENGRRVRASPAARRAAAERDLPIRNVSGSGPHGRIYLSDVLETDSGLRTPEPEVAEDAGYATPAPALREPLSRIRRIAAERTARSFSEVPHFYLTRDLEADRLLDLVGRLREKMEPAPSVTELLALVVARTLKDHPRLNGRYANGELELNPWVNLGIAVATEAGLVVPVLKGADALSLRELVPAVKDLVRRARDDRLRPEELSGGTFTLSNLGTMQIDSFNPIINAPEVAILAVGRVRTVPEWRDGEWIPRRVIFGTLSVDHRVADGADGARFFLDVQAALSDWELLL
jgi:pyruvate dehydrogenase E2 component (dihydrolipoyllysine-residue acetyltransferase)